MHNLFQLPSHWLKFKLWHRQQSRTCLQTFQKDKQKQKQKQKSPHYPVWRSFPVDTRQKQGRPPSTCSVPAYENQPATRLPPPLLQSSGDKGQKGLDRTLQNGERNPFSRQAVTGFGRAFFIWDRYGTPLYCGKRGLLSRSRSCPVCGPPNSRAAPAVRSLRAAPSNPMSQSC